MAARGAIGWHSLSYFFYLAHVHLTSPGSACAAGRANHSESANENMSAKVQSGRHLAGDEFLSFDVGHQRSTLALVDRSKARQEKNTVPVLASLDELPPTKKFHCISLFETLEHLEHPLELLTRLRGEIIDDVILILEVSDCTGVNGISSEYDYRKIDPLEHINAFVPSTLRSIAERAGFVSIRSPSAYVTDSLVVVAKRAIKPLVKRSQKATQQYFHARRSYRDQFRRTDISGALMFNELIT